MAPCLGRSSCPLQNQRQLLNSRPGAGLRRQCQPQCTIRLSNSPSSAPRQVGKSALSLPVTRENIEFVRQRLEQLLYRSSADQLNSHVLSLSETWQMPQQIIWESANLSPPETPGKGNQKGENFHANVGDAIRTLREDIPLLFVNDLNYDIYRDDIAFRDPRNCFMGKRNYKIIFWSLRFHGAIFFSSLYVDVKRIWQPEDMLIRMRWTVHGIPRVPWDAEGVFDGISTFKLDKDGKIYEHSVDNVLLQDPPSKKIPLFAGLNLIPSLQPQQQPCPGAWGFLGAEEKQVQQQLQQLENGWSWVAPLFGRSQDQQGRGNVQSG